MVHLPADLGIMCVCVVCGNQKRVLDPLELELETVVSCHVISSAPYTLKLFEYSMICHRNTHLASVARQSACTR